MAESVIALSYVGMTSAMTKRKFVIRKSYVRMTTLCHDFFCGGVLQEVVRSYRLYLGGQKMAAVANKRRSSFLHSHDETIASSIKLV
jgi:hypothetical protein